MAMNGRPSSSNRTSTESRVVPGRSETIIRSAWARVLMKVDLPVLGRPTTAIFITASAGGAAWACGSISSMQLQELLLVAVLLRRDVDRLAPAELVELAAPLVELGVSALFITRMTGVFGVAEPLGDLLVQRHHAVADVDDEEDQVGLVHRGLDLPLDVLAEVVAVDHADPAGVHQLEEPGLVVVPELDQGADAVAGHARHVVDDGDPATGQPVEQRRLADVRPTDDHDLRECHRIL